MNEIILLIRAHANDSECDRIALFNAITRELSNLVNDISGDPVTSVQLVPVNQLHANDYNPNRVASVEMDLLEQSMRADGITMPVVAMADDNGWTVIDGFHRRTVASNRLNRKYIPVSVIARSRADRMASTVRHNRARGKHQVDLMASLMKQMMDQGWTEEKTAEALGMSIEESLRLRQMVGAARLLASDVYSRSMEVIADIEATE